MNTAGQRAALLTIALLLVLVSGTAVPSVFANERPVAEAGPSRYVAQDPAQLDGSGSYDPDHSGPLSYAWRQVSGPPVTLTGADTATLKLKGFTQTEEIQACEFELIVKDGERASLPDRVKVTIVPTYSNCTMTLENPAFDANKPTVLFFHGGTSVSTGGGRLNDSLWSQKANIISFPSYVGDPETFPGPIENRHYLRPADRIIVYLSSVAPGYRQPIQTFGWSIGGLLALDVAARLNLTYADARYAVNHATLVDPSAWVMGNAEYDRRVAELLAHPVDKEQCWVEVLEAANASVTSSALNVVFAPDHALPWNWYRTSLARIMDPGIFNYGLSAGAYWSVVGPGRNLQLALTPELQIYKFKWTGSATVGHMDFHNESTYPGRLPEPVILGAWANRSKATGEIDGAVLSCRYSENAVGYQLLVGSDPYRVMDFRIVSDTPAPPMEILREFPTGQDWWTVRVQDRYGSTIYADPVRFDLTNLPSLSVQNTRTGKRYGLIEHAIREAQAGDVISLDPGTYEENIEFSGQAVAVSSWAPDDPAIVAATVLRGQGDGPAVVFSGPESANCVLTGLTIRSDTAAVSCRDAVPTIRNCVLGDTGSIAVEFWWGYRPNLVACTLVGQMKEGGDPGLIAYWRLDEAAGTVAAEGVGGSNGVLLGAAVWQPTGGRIGGALQLDGVDGYVQTNCDLNPVAGPFSVFAWVKGGAPGQAIVSQTDGINWLAVAPGGVLKTDLRESTRSGKPLVSSAVITDGAWHRVGLTWDGSKRVLYVDGAEVAKDTTALSAGLTSSAGGLRFGAGSTLASGTFWSGLIDDVRIYNRAVNP